MSNNLEVSEGAAGKYAKTTETGSGVHRQVVEGGGVLQHGYVTTTSVTCTLGTTDYAAGANVPAWARYLRIECASDCVVAIGEATSATVGLRVKAGVTESSWPLSPLDVAGGVAVHAQSPTAGAVVYLTYLCDARDS